MHHENFDTDVLLASVVTHKSDYLTTGTDQIIVTCAIECNYWVPTN